MSRRLPGFLYQAIGTILTDHRVAAFHRRLYHRTAGSGIVGHALGVPMILLTTTGRRTGIARVSPLVAIPDGDDWLVVASNGGRGRLPGWAHNLRADARATVRYRDRVSQAQAREAVGEEHDRVWPLAVSAYPGYEVYAARSSTPITVFVLETA